MDFDFPGKIAVMGGGSWATALSKLLMAHGGSIIWYMRRRDRIDDFRRLGHNPVYLSDIAFDTDRIAFTDDINLACSEADTLLLVTPSPYFLSHVNKITVDISSKSVVSAIKGMVPGENRLISDYMTGRFAIDPDRMLVVSGPCHAEEVALGRQSYLTVGCRNLDNAELFADRLRGRGLSAVTSTDVTGIELASVLKNVYAIAAGIIHGLKSGDNLLAVMVSNAIREMERFIAAVSPDPARHIDNSVYLGDLLVTCYSNFSRNHNFGAMIGRGYSVRSARMEMEQTAEGYFGTACVHAIHADRVPGVEAPLAEAVYDILYNGAPADLTMRRVSRLFT